MRYLVGFLCVCALGVMGCSETAGTDGSGGAEGECILDAAAQACLDSGPWVYTFAGFTSFSWMNFASGTVTGVSASTMLIDVSLSSLSS